MALDMTSAFPDLSIISLKKQCESFVCEFVNINEKFRTIHDILKHECFDEDSLLFSAVGKTCKEINNTMQNINSCYLAIAEHLLNMGKIAEATEYWEKILSWDPMNSSVHRRLNELILSYHNLKNWLEKILRKYRFDNIGSFGHNIFSNTSAIIVAAYDGSIYTYEQNFNRINKFNADEVFEKNIALAFNKPQGIFEDNNDNIWICDKDNGRLVLVDGKGSIINIIRIKDISGNKLPDATPILGILHKTCIYLVLKNEEAQLNWLAYFDKRSPHDILGVIPLKNIFNPVNLYYDKEKIFIGCNKIGYIYSVDLVSGQLRRLRWNHIPFLTRRFVKSHEGFFLSTGENIVKLSNDGELIFTINFREATKTNNALPASLAVKRGENGEILFVIDKCNECIHKFYI